MLPIHPKDKTRLPGRRLARLIVPFSVLFFATVHISLDAKLGPDTLSPNARSLNTAVVDPSAADTAGSVAAEPRVEKGIKVGATDSATKQKDATKAKDPYPEMTGGPIDPSESFAPETAGDPDDFTVVAASLKAKLAKEDSEPNKQAEMERELAKIKAEAAKKQAAEEIRDQKAKQQARQTAQERAIKDRALEQKYLREARAEVDQFEGIEDFQLSWTGLEESPDVGRNHRALFIEGAYGPENELHPYE